MKPLGLLLLTGLLGVAPVHAQDIFECVDAQGRKSFTNTNENKGCKRLNVQPIATVPAPRLPAAAAGNGSPIRPAVEQRAAGFPRVEADTQRARDSDRRRILEDELKAEEERLARLRTEFNSGQPERNGDETRNFARYQERVARMQEDIQRSESNVTALRRELAMLRN
jgi:acyl-CoA reductase-like NAD-dependent aldehyde dehydrogenase